MVSSSLRRSVGLLSLFASPSIADLPYNPTRILATNDGKAAYILASQSSSSQQVQLQLQLLNTSSSIDVSDPPVSRIEADLPLQDSPSTALTPFLNGDDLIVLAGSGCDGGSPQAELWHLAREQEEETGRWDKLSLESTSSSVASHILSAGFSFSPTASQSDTSLYLFGGMCSNGTSSAEDWTSMASYTNEIVKISPNLSTVASYPGTDYASSTISSRGPPVAEAGLTITALTPTNFDRRSSSVSQQQNFALIGGHTDGAFINMSQIALFSLPEESWSFEAIRQANRDEANPGSTAESIEVEPRSGHSAVITNAGDKIIIMGGWVGDVSTPAEPPLAVLEIGQGYGGTGEWKWTIPYTTASPFKPGQGIYGHGAAVLRGDVMIVSGGYSISADSSEIHRRQEKREVNQRMFLFNTTSNSFLDTYTNPGSALTGGSAESQSGSNALSTTSQKAGLGAGLVLGLLAIAGTAAFYFWYSRRLRQRRTIREKELRELALGADRFYASSLSGGGVDGRGGQHYPDTRSASWGSRQEKNMFGPGDELSWAPIVDVGSGRYGGGGMDGNGERAAERTGLLLDLPSPTRGLRRSMHPKGMTYSSLGIGAPGSSPYGPSAGNGEIHTIAEQDEESEGEGNLKRHKSTGTGRGHVRPESGASDPFRDPPPQLCRSQSEVDRLRREREIRGWTDDWEAAGAAMDSGREYDPPSSSRNEQKRSNSSSNDHSRSRSDSPDKSDRTNSNLSEKSTMSSSSIQRSLLGSITRNVSMRSASAGYVLFANAAAAMTGKATLVNHPGPYSPPTGMTGDGGTGIGRESSRRSASLNLNSTASSRYNHKRRDSHGDRASTFSSTVHTNFGPSHPSEHESLLSPGTSPTRQADGQEEAFATRPESPVRERNASVSSPLAAKPGKKTQGWMGSVRRALTANAGPGGTGASVAVKRRVEALEQKDGGSGSGSAGVTGSTRRRTQEMTEDSSARGYGTAGNSVPPRRAVSASASLWRGKKGAKDWEVSSPTTSDTKTSTPAAGQPLPPSRSTTAATAAAAVVRDRSSSFSSSKPTPLTGAGANGVAGSDAEAEAEEWDVEAAAEKRLVQVMFTVPREKLRVVNADADVDQLSVASGQSGDGDLKGKHGGGNEDGNGDGNRREW